MLFVADQVDLCSA